MATRATTKKTTTRATSKTEVKVHNAITVDTKNPLPQILGSSTFTDTGGHEYYPFFAPNDNLFRTLLELRLLSPTHDACIEDKTFYTVGDGLQVQEQDFPTDFDKKLNGKRQTIDDILKAIAESYFQDGNKFIEVVRLDIDGTKYVHVYPHNNMDCRLQERKDGEDPTHVLRSRQFRRDGFYSVKDVDRDKVKRIPLFQDDAEDSEVWVKGKNGEERTMFLIKNEMQGIDHYGMPSYYSGLLNILLEHRATSFNLDNFDNNMFLAGLLFIQGAMSGVEEKKLLTSLKKMYTGQGKGMRVLPLSSESGLQDSKFHPFNNRNEGHFMEFDKHNIDKIITAHKWSKDLMDMKEGSGLGKGGEFLKQLFRIKFRTVISPVQQNLVNNFVFPLMQIIDEWIGRAHV